MAYIFVILIICHESDIESDVYVLQFLVLLFYVWVALKLSCYFPGNSFLWCLSDIILPDVCLI